MRISNGYEVHNINFKNEYESSRAVNKYTYNNVQLHFLGLTEKSIDDYKLIVNSEKYRLVIKCYKDLYERANKRYEKILNNKYLTNIKYLDDIGKIRKATGFLLVLINDVLSLYHE